MAGGRQPVAANTSICACEPGTPASFEQHVMAAVLANMFYTQRTESIIAVGFIGVGAIVYFVFFGRRTSRGADAQPAPQPIPAEESAV